MMDTDTEKLESESDPAVHAKQGRRPYRVSLPRFVTGDEDVGLGDVIKRATTAIGVEPCGGCAERAARLNHWLVFRGRHSR